METTEELQQFITDMCADGVRNQLLERGTAWSLIREQEVLPSDAPALGAAIETDLAEYGFSVLRAALSLRERNVSAEDSRRGFERAARAFESLVQNGLPDNVERGFHRVIAGAAYHLAGYSAIAYSLLSEHAEDGNNNAAEKALIYPILRDLTRIAELAALMALSTDKRVLIVTPLRALSAQTERSFRRTFAPLGFSVSSLYGASGVSADDEDALKSRNIVIATPEKLDFALRNDPNLIDDVGLIVLDEGHMIGPTEREIRYETLVQRLLRRADAGTRRIVCLSAILPDGEQLDDLTAWIRSDTPGFAVKCPWRPTRQRFGALMWQGKSAKLYFDAKREVPFLSRFVEQVPPRGRQKTPLPKDTKDLTIFAAWKFAEQGKRTLIFITQANWVEGYGDVALDLVQRGYLPSLLDEPASIARALEVGREWLGDDHRAVKALKIGVAIHHGGLPNPFLRELELLLSQGSIKVTAASPTLSQGLNLNAAVMLVPSLHRSGEIISGEEFANVAGRAGRAFVDVEELVVHVMHAGDEWRLKEWRKLIDSARSCTLQSGLVHIVAEILSRFASQGILNRPDVLEYLANSREPWNANTGTLDDAEPLSELVEKLDATVFGLIEALDADRADLPNSLMKRCKVRCGRDRSLAKNPMSKRGTRPSFRRAQAFGVPPRQHPAEVISRWGSGWRPVWRSIRWLMNSGL